MPQAKSVILAKVLVAAVLLGGGVLIGWKYFTPSGGGSVLGNLLPERKVDNKVTLSVLHSEAMTFLVTRRTTTQIVVEHNESGWTGRWQAILWATVKWSWGCDLSKVSEKDLRREGEVIYCRLPEPELFECSIVPGSENFYSKSTVVPKLQEFFSTGQQQKKLHDQICLQAERFAISQNLKPSRAEMVKQLNESTAALKQATGVDVRFE